MLLCNELLYELTSIISSIIFKNESSSREESQEDGMLYRTLVIAASITVT